MIIESLRPDQPPLEIIRQEFINSIDTSYHYVVFKQGKKFKLHVVDADQGILLSSKEFSEYETAVSQYQLTILADEYLLASGHELYSCAYPELPPQDLKLPIGVVPGGESKGGHLS
jgi:hypothetical protein